jgi:bla regulator protein BlaR1
MRLRNKLLLLSFAFVVIATLAGQSPDEPDWQTAAGGKMAFEVASVKLANSGVPGTTPWTRMLFDRGNAKPPGGTFSANISLDFYIYFAYKLAPFEAMDLHAKLPKWANKSYAIDAKAEGNPTKDQMRLMMQSLLADRFKLKVHFENREVPVLVLTPVKPGKLGPKLLPHSEGPPCPDSFDDHPFPPIPPPKPGVAWPPQCGTTAQMGTRDGTWLGSRNTTMGLLAKNLYNPQFGVDQPVVDQTGLPGRFDFILELPAGMISLGPKPPNPDDAPPQPIFLKALREQLGLKLVRSRGEVRRLIIDHIQRPSNN